MSNPEKPSIFFLGATGYLGSQLLLFLAKEFPDYSIVALSRTVSPERVAQLEGIHPHISIVKGTLDDVTLIKEQALKHPIVINCASSDHAGSVQATLKGLEEHSENCPGKPPLYIHVSGSGIISDNCKGEPVDQSKLKVWTDVGLNLRECDPVNNHLEVDNLIVDAGSRRENPVRTIIVFPSWIYGVGDGIQKITMPIRYFMNMAKTAGHAGTWGPGANSMGTIHVRDCADAVLTCLKAALIGKADVGAEGLYFATSPEYITMHSWNAAFGDILYEKGVLKEPGAKPYPPEVIEPMGHYGWSCLGGNLIAKAEKLYGLGWNPTESEMTPIMQSLPEEVEALMKDLGSLSMPDAYSHRQDERGQ